MKADKKRFLTDMGFVAEIAAVDLGFCPFCRQPVVQGEFKDARSEREFGISGLCQKCQDSMFL